MNENKKILSILILIFIDLIAFYTSLLLAYFSRKFLDLIDSGLNKLEFDFFHFVFNFWWMPTIFIFFIYYEKLYTRKYPFWDEVIRLLKGISIAVLFIFAIISLGKLEANISRLTILFLWIYSLVIFPLFRYISKNILNKLDFWKENIIIIGAGNTGISTAKGLINDHYMGYKVVGFLDDNKQDFVEIDNKKIPILGKIKDIDNFIKTKNINAVIVAIPSMDREKLTKLINHVYKYTKKIFVVPDLKGISLLNTELYHLFLQQLFLIRINNNLETKINFVLKRVFDIIISILILPILLLLILILAIIIKLDSKGSIFFVQERVGKDGKIFKCYKFRTMYENSNEILEKYLRENPVAKEEWEKYKKLKSFDPRVTRVGKFLRKTSLDELPQIFNVLKGDMSLVGPRPYLPSEIESMGDYANFILMTLPGITGLWQISGRNELEFKERLKLDTWYVLNWSLWLDLIILIRTIKTVLKKEGAY